MTKIKICGITRREDARFCAELGADFLGMVFVRESPRYVTPGRVLWASDLSVKKVGVFRNESAETMNAIADEVGLDYIQLHGDEPDDLVLNRPVIRALRVTDRLPATNANAEWLLFDSGGGTGKTFDWSLLEAHPRTKPFFLAGGITPENVAEAIRRVRPDAIDVSSGVESAPGIKDHHKLRALFGQVKR
jgi:phosphoribosylanthranilate isomerase